MVYTYTTTFRFLCQFNATLTIRTRIVKIRCFETWVRSNSLHLLFDFIPWMRFVMLAIFRTMSIPNQADPFSSGKQCRKRNTRDKYFSFSKVCEKSIDDFRNVCLKSTFAQTMETHLLTNDGTENHGKCGKAYFSQVIHFVIFSILKDHCWTFFEIILWTGHKSTFVNFLEIELWPESVGYEKRGCKCPTEFKK